MIGRLRMPEVAMVPLAAVLALDVALVDWFDLPTGAVGGLDSGLVGWLALLLAVVAVIAVTQTVFRRAATGALAAEVAVFLLAPLSLLCFLVAAFAPGTFAGEGATAAAGFWIAGVSIAALLAVDVAALRSDSRGIRPDPPAPVELLDLPGRPGSHHDG